MPRKREHQEELDRAVAFIDKCQAHHDEVMRGVDKRADAYHGVLRRQADKGWESKVYGKYAMHIVDTTLASMVEDRLRYRIRPRKTMADIWDPTADERLRQGAEAHGILMEWQNRQSKFTRIQRPFILQNAIAGLTASKTTWVERVERRRRMVAEDQPLLNEVGDQIIHPVHGPMVYPHLVECVQHLPVYDGPWTEVVDIHDLFWPENARSIDDSRYIGHRIWLSREELEREFEEGGMYGPANGGWDWKKVQADIGTTREHRDTAPRWGENRSQIHDKDRLEIIEVWDTFLKQVVTFVNRKSLIGYKDKFPYFHEKTPFDVCSTQPGLFEIVGVSQIEKVQDIQEMLWNIQNQTLDNLTFLNNAITIYRPDVEDADALEYAPRAMWPLEDPSMVQMWHPDPIPAEISIGRERMLMGDMQNLAGTFPFSTGAESATIDQKTATGASLVSGLAQRSIDLAKQPLYQTWEDIGNKKLILNNQFITAPTAATVLGADGEEEVRTIWPELLQGDYEYEQEPIPDAIMQQQEQAKWTAALQVALQAAPIILPLSQAGAARMLNIDAYVEENLKALGIEDTDRFFLGEAPSAAALPQQGGQPTAGEEAPLGITAGEGGTAPGTQMQDSPDIALQRAAALGAGGGPRNV